MTGQYQYKPKLGLDMRIRPPKKGDEERERDVHALKEGEKRCEWPGCVSPGSARAPKSRDMPNEHYWFCTPHAGAYNKQWDYFSGMSEGEIAAKQVEDRMTGGRPTWAFRAASGNREQAAKMSKGGFQDAHGFFGTPGESKPATAASRRIGKIESKALADLDLEPGVEKDAIRARYTELLKRLHPDSNGGDRSMEDKLQRVIKAYKALKSSGLV
jgi:DnaJ-domain-containing protein 1